MRWTCEAGASIIGLPICLMSQNFPFLRVSAVVALGLSMILALPAAVLAAQNPPLAEVARKEQERRKARPSASKVYTNSDLPKSAIHPEPVVPSPPAATPAEAERAAEPSPPAQPQEVRDEAWWRARITDAREAVRRNEVFAEALQSRINALHRDFVSRDNPVQRRQIAQERAEALDELARVRQEIEAAKTQIADIEEEARKAGVPPGWLR